MRAMSLSYDTEARRCRSDGHLGNVLASVIASDERHEPAESIDRGCEVCVARHQHTSPHGPV